MLKYKKILVPYDGSDHAKKAVQQASDLAAAGDGTKIYIASVCNMVSAMSNFDQVSIAEGCLTTKLLEDRESQCREEGYCGSQVHDSEGYPIREELL